MKLTNTNNLILHDVPVYSVILFLRVGCVSMNFSVSALLSFLFVIQAVNHLGPLPARVKSQVTRYQNNRYEMIEKATSDLVAELDRSAWDTPSYLGLTELPAKPLMTFEKYLASKKRQKVIRRSIASIPKVKSPASNRSESKQRPLANLESQ